MTHSAIPPTPADVPVFLAFEHPAYGPSCIMSDGHRISDGPLQHFLPLLPGPTVADATRIFAPQRFARDLAGKLTAEHDRPVRVRRVRV